MKLWIDGERDAPDASWTRVMTAPEAIALIEKPGVQEISVDENLLEPPTPTDPEEAERARLYPYTVKRSASDVLEAIMHMLEYGGFMPPAIRVHTDTNERAWEATQLSRQVRAIEYRAEYAQRFKADDDWKRFLKESEKEADEAWKKERAARPNELILDGPDHRPVAQFLLKRLKDALPELEMLIDDAEDEVYRFYHQSYKVFSLNGGTRRIVALLHSVLPHQKLNKWFLQIVAEAESREWDRDRGGAINDSWLSYTRPVVEAFFHAQYFLRMCMRFAKELETPPAIMPSGWAAVLYLFNLR